MQMLATSCPNLRNLPGKHTGTFFSQKRSMLKLLPWYSPNSITPTFTKTSLRGKSWTQTVTNHEVMKFRWKSRTKIISTSRCLRQSPWQVRDKRVCVALMEFGPLQCTGKVDNKVRGLCRGHKSRKSATQIMKVGDLICVADFHDLCPRLSPWGSFGESRKVGVMEFGFM